MQPFCFLVQFFSPYCYAPPMRVDWFCSVLSRFPAAGADASDVKPVSSSLSPDSRLFFPSFFLPRRWMRGHFRQTPAEADRCVMLTIHHKSAGDAVCNEEPLTADKDGRRQSRKQRSQHPSRPPEWRVVISAQPLSVPSFQLHIEMGRAPRGKLLVTHNGMLLPPS